MSNVCQPLFTVYKSRDIQCASICHDVLDFPELTVKATCFNVTSSEEQSNIITNGNMPLWETILKLVEVSVLQINAIDCR